jgi:exosortase F-associated protein
MLKNLKNNKAEILLGIFLVALLILIRTFEDTLFYDPLLKYFRYDFNNMKLPILNPIKLFISMGFRYYLNSMISLGLLYLIFKDRKIVKFSMLLFIIFGSILMISFLFTLHFFGEEHKMALFYIRRFLIQPIFLILFVPAFYYQKKMKQVL